MNSDTAHPPSESNTTNEQSRQRRSRSQKRRKKRSSREPEREAPRHFGSITFAIIFVVIAIFLAEKYIAPESYEKNSEEQITRTVSPMIKQPQAGRAVQSDFPQGEEYYAYGAYTKFDWDAYLKKQNTSNTQVHVIVSPGSHYQGSYADQDTWLCFRLVAPNCSEDLYAYSRIDDKISDEMQQAILDSDELKLPMTLKLMAKGSQEGFHLFEIKELVALEWVK